MINAGDESRAPLHRVTNILCLNSHIAYDFWVSVSMVLKRRVQSDPSLHNTFAVECVQTDALRASVGVCDGFDEHWVSEIEWKRWFLWRATSYNQPPITHTHTHPTYTYKYIRYETPQEAKHLLLVAACSLKAYLTSFVVVVRTGRVSETARMIDSRRECS